MKSRLRLARLVLNNEMGVRDGFLEPARETGARKFPQVFDHGDDTRDDGPGRTIVLQGLGILTIAGGA